MQKQLLSAVFFLGVIATMAQDNIKIDDFLVIDVANSAKDSGINHGVPRQEAFVYKLRPYLEAGNAEGMAQLTAEVKALKKRDRYLDADGYLNLRGNTRSRINHVLNNIIEKKHDKTLELAAPFLLETGHSFIHESGNTHAGGGIKGARWAVDVVSRKPELIMADIHNLNKREIDRAWRFLPRRVQKRVLKATKHYYHNNCPASPEYTTNGDTPCEILYEKLLTMACEHNKFADLCRIMPEELEEQQADGRLAANEPLEFTGRELAAENISNSSEQGSASIESAPEGNQV